MSLMNREALLIELLPLIAADDSAFDRFCQSTNTLANALRAEFHRVGTPESEQNRLIGHFGLLGETNNTVAFVYNRMHPPYAKGPPNPEKLLIWTQILCERLQEDSQMARALGNNETQSEAFRRIGSEIADWVERHTDQIPPKKRQTLTKLLTIYSESYDELDATLSEAGRFFKKNHPPSKSSLEKLYKLTR